MGSPVALTLTSRPHSMGCQLVPGQCAKSGCVEVMYVLYSGTPGHSVLKTDSDSIGNMALE